MDQEHRREQSGEDTAEQFKGECYFFEMSCRENRNVHHPLHLLAGMIDRMVESLVQKKVPIPRAKPRLADATPSSVLSRSNEFRLDKAKAKISSASASASSASSSASSSYASEGEDETKIEGKGEVKGERRIIEVDGKEGKVANPISSPKPRPPTVPPNWWENSPYVKRIGDDCIFSFFLFFSLLCKINFDSLKSFLHVLSVLRRHQNVYQLSLQLQKRH